MKITIPSDLRSLYLASKRWNHAATVALYRKIVLDTSLPLDQLEKFEQCMHRGALKHLKDARDLTLYDASAIGEQKIRGQPRARGSSQAISKTQEAVLRVLKLFPNNRMTTFRYARFGVINAIALIPEICNLVHFQYCTTRSTFMDTERLHTLQDFFAEKQRPRPCSSQSPQIEILLHMPCTQTEDGRGSRRPELLSALAPTTSA